MRNVVGIITVGLILVCYSFGQTTPEPTKADFSGTWTLDKTKTKNLPAELEEYVLKVAETTERIEIKTEVKGDIQMRRGGGGGNNGGSGGGGGSGTRICRSANSDGTAATEGPQLRGLQSGPSGRGPIVRRGAGGRSHRPRLSQQRHPRGAACGRRERSASVERRDRTTAQATARATIGGQGPAEPALACHRNRPAHSGRHPRRLSPLLHPSRIISKRCFAKTSPQVQ